MIKEILGFADFPTDARYPTVELLGKGLIPAWNPGATSAYIGCPTYNGRRWLRVFGVAYPRVDINLKDVGFTLDEIKTRKIYGGFRYVISNNASLGGDPILQLSRGSYYNLLLESSLTALQGEAYIEFMIDVSTLTFKTWVDGVLKNSGALTSGETASATDTIIRYGQGAGSPTSEQHWYNDFYWVLDTSDIDATPSKRLGPVKVGAVRMDASELPTDWTVPEGQTPEDILDTTTLGPSTETTKVIRTSPAETVASFSFGKPETEFPIKAVSVEVYGFRDTGTVPTLQTQLRQGETLADQQTHVFNTNVLREGSNANRIGCMNTDLDGKPWTVEAVDQLEILINSKTGS